MSKKILFTFFLLFFVGQAHSNDKNIIIQGDKQALELSDIPTPPYEYNNLNIINETFNPKKEMLDILNDPDSFLGIDMNKVVLDFDEIE